MTNPVQPAPGTTGPVGEGVLNAEGAWRKMLIRFGVTNPRLIQRGSALLDEVDRITGISSKSRPS